MGKTKAIHLTNREKGKIKPWYISRVGGKQRQYTPEYLTIERRSKNEQTHILLTRKNKELLCHTRAEEDEGAIFHAHVGGTTRKIGREGAEPGFQYQLNLWR